MINRTKVKESTQIKPGDNGDVLVMKDNAPEWSTPSDAGLAEQANVDLELDKKQDKLVAGDNIHIDGNTISADGKPTPINIGTVISGEVPMVSNSGTDTDVVLNFVLPKGDKGDPGKDGTQINNLSPLVVETAPSVTEGKVGLAIGDGATADGGFAIGNRAKSGSLEAMAIGEGAIATSFGALAIGRGAEAKNNESIAIGEGSLSTAYSVAVGRDTTAESMFSTALGCDSYSNGNAVAAGSSSYATARSVAIGYGSSAGGGTAVTVGCESGAASTTEIDYDDGAWYDIGSHSVAIGDGALITKGDHNVVSFGNGGINEYWVRQSQQSVKHVTSASGPETRRLINVTDPTNAQDAATKNYVDTQLAPLSTLQSTVTQQAETIAQLQQTVTQLQATINNLTLETERI